MHDLICGDCGAAAATGPVYPVRCGCGGLWEAADPGIYLTGRLEDPGHVTPVWRDPREELLWWKREDLSRTGSFKDRGARVLVAWAAVRGASRLVADSSGSAGLALASSAARHGLPIRVHVPAAVPPEMCAVLSALGADVEARGSREQAATRALEEASVGFYASHVHHPAFTAGTSTAGAEAIAQFGGDLPPTWILPVGNGSLLLGLAQALLRSARPGIRLVTVQAAACAGLLRPGVGGTTAAAGIAIAAPARRAEILRTIERSGGEILEVGESEILEARELLWRRGAAVETASAAALAGVHRLRERGDRTPVLGFLTGSGHRGR